MTGKPQASDIGAHGNSAVDREAVARAAARRPLRRAPAGRRRRSRRIARERVGGGSACRSIESSSDRRFGVTPGYRAGRTVVTSASVAVTTQALRANSDWMALAEPTDSRAAQRDGHAVVRVVLSAALRAGARLLRPPDARRRARRRPDRRDVRRRAVRPGRRYRPERGRADSWLFAIAYHKLADAQRRGAAEDRARRRLGDGADRADRRRRAARSSSSPARTARWRPVERLPADQREAIRAHVVRGRS